ncbi:MAG: hypothetical protein U0441_18260 [Polyangiaceae bacterium]
MQFRFPLLVFGAAAFAVAIGACAKGTSFSGIGGDGGEGAGYAEGATGGGGNGYGAGGSGASTTSDSTSSADTTSSSTTTTTGTGGSGAGGSGGGGAGGGGECFSSPNLCSNADQLPDVSGDEGGTSTASGSTSKWLKVHVTETDSSIFASDLSYRVTLSSPPGMDYDLYVKEGPQDGNPDCGATSVKGTPGAGGEQVSASWNDDQGLGGEDDSLWLCIEVQYVSGSDCNAQWSLTVVGNP